MCDSGRQFSTPTAPSDAGARDQWRARSGRKRRLAQVSTRLLRFVGAPGRPVDADVTGASGYPTAVNQYNHVTFTAVSTTRLRVVLTGSTASVGLLEVKAFS